MKVICNMAGFCSEEICGAKDFHEYNPKECGYCPENKCAYCVEIEAIAEQERLIKSQIERSRGQGNGVDLKKVKK